ncbi:hypothetical protein V1478_011682 [Vespula squamosa]|uniref:Uncharacterized protein n=1 Tax=Vespula squamosa TaxID=30214 RepID=A0ABD2AF60_VESSQ
MSETEVSSVNSNAVSRTVAGLYIQIGALYLQGKGIHFQCIESNVNKILDEFCTNVSARILYVLKEGLLVPGYEVEDRESHL